MKKKEIVSIVIPCRNEEKYIEKCIQSVLDFNIPPNLRIELIVVDGFSTDKTWEILQNFKQDCLTIITLKNQDIYVSFALNKAIKIAKGDWIMRLDAHSNFPKNYLEKCYETAKATGADNVGGMVITHPGGTGFQAGIVQALTTHVFGVGDSGFRTGIKSGAVDTVPFGFFRREIFQKIGYFDQRLIRAQDYELNARIKSASGLVWLNPEIKAHYFNQSSFFKFLRKQFLKEAPYNAYLWFLAPYAFAPRHAITGAFALGVLAGFLFSPFTNWILFPFVYIFSLLDFSIGGLYSTSDSV